MTIWRARATSGAAVSTFRLAATCMLHAGISFGTFSTFTRHMRQLPETGRCG